MQKARIRHLWNTAYPRQLLLETPAALDRYLEKLERQQHFFLAEEGLIAGWLLLFRRDGLTWFALIVASERQGRGYGRLLLREACKQASELHGWVVDHGLYTRADGHPYRPPLDFYLREGFQLLDDRLNEPIRARHIFWQACSKARPLK